MWISAARMHWLLCGDAVCCGMMIGCAASTCLSGCDERVRVTATACGERPGQGGGNPGAASPDRGAGAATGYGSAAVLPERPGIPGRPAAPAPAGRAWPVPASGAPGDNAALAPGPAGAPPRGQVPPWSPGPTANLWVPRTSSTSCDQAVFVDHAADASVSSDAVLPKIDRVG